MSHRRIHIRFPRTFTLMWTLCLALTIKDSNISWEHGWIMRTDYYSCFEVLFWNIPDCFSSFCCFSEGLDGSCWVILTRDVVFVVDLRVNVSDMKWKQKQRGDHLSWRCSHWTSWSLVDLSCGEMITSPASVWISEITVCILLLCRMQPHRSVNYHAQSKL